MRCWLQGRSNSGPSCSLIVCKAFVSRSQDHYDYHRQPEEFEVEMRLQPRLHRLIIICFQEALNCHTEVDMEHKS